MRYLVYGFAAVLALSACARTPATEAAAPTFEGAVTRPVARPSALETRAAPPPSTARTAAQFDTVSAGEKAAAEAAAQEAAAAGAGRALGVTIASLGDPAQPGLWIKTPLVSTAGRGRVVYPKTGKAVELDLIPLEGPMTGGSRMSLAALRVLEAPLTDLPEVEVYQN